MGSEPGAPPVFVERPTEPIVRDAFALAALPALLAGLALVAGWSLIALVLAGLAVFVMAFFRNPSRTIPGDERTVVSPADGRVVAVGEVEEPGGEKRLRIGIFLSVFNVHVNRVPVAGRVLSVARRGSAYLAAFNLEAESKNVACDLVLETAAGERVRVSQITGLIARRIVCHPQPGEWLARGVRYGLIRFGSRTDVVLPARREPRSRRGIACAAGAASSRRSSPRDERRVSVAGLWRLHRAAAPAAPRARVAPPGLHLLPNLFTTGNLFFGFYTIVHATLGDRDRAALGIVLAMVFDILDGRVARLARATSRFGAEYDSLSDVVSFGVAPAVLAFSAGELRELGRAGWVLAFVYTVCAALRLARFNVHQSRYRGRFEGLPSPAAAGMVAATVWFASFLEESLGDFTIPAWPLALGTAVLGLLMVSTIPYRSFKEVDLRHSYGTLVVLALVLPLVAIEPGLTLFGVALAYVASGPVESWWRWRHGGALEEVAPVPEPDASGEERVHEHH